MNYLYVIQLIDRWLVHIYKSKEILRYTGCMTYTTVFYRYNMLHLFLYTTLVYNTRLFLWKGDGFSKKKLDARRGENSLKALQRSYKFSFLIIPFATFFFKHKGRLYILYPAT